MSQSVAKSTQRRQRERKSRLFFMDPSQGAPVPGLSWLPAQIKDAVTISQCPLLMTRVGFISELPCAPISSVSLSKAQGNISSVPAEGRKDISVRRGLERDSSGTEHLFSYEASLGPTSSTNTNKHTLWVKSTPGLHNLVFWDC